MSLCSAGHPSDVVGRVPRLCVLHPLCCCAHCRELPSPAPAKAPGPCPPLSLALETENPRRPYPGVCWPLIAVMWTSLPPPCLPVPKISYLMLCLPITSRYHLEGTKALKNLRRHHTVDAVKLKHMPSEALRSSLRAHLLKSRVSGVPPYRGAGKRGQLGAVRVGS